MRSLLFAFVMTVTSACGGEGDGAPDAAPADPDPDFDDTAASIELSMRDFGAEGGDTTLLANVVVDDPIWPYDVEPVVGGCRFSVRREMTCDPLCQGVCVGDTCQMQPAVQSAGDLTLSTGGATRVVSFDAAGYAFYEQALPFAPGATLTVSAPGDEVAAFTLAAEVPPPFTVSNRDELMLAAGTPLTLRWQPADPGSRVRIQLGADLGHAQYRAALIECDAPDEAGAIAIPQAMVDRLADRSLWSCGDCFPHAVKRYRRVRGSAGALELSLWLSQSEPLYLVP